MPLHNPLIVRRLTVIADLHNGQAPGLRTRIDIDSGAFVSSLKKEELDQLGSTYRKSPLLRIVGMSGQSRTWVGTSVDQVRIGDLRMRDVTFYAGGNANLLGNDLLSRRPWSVDIDRGLVTLGADVWVGDDVVTVPFHSAEPHHTVLVDFDGHPALMYFDTGASGVSMDRESCEAAELDVRMLRSPERWFGVHGSEVVDRVFIARSASLGPLALGEVEVRPMAKYSRGDRQMPIVGLLGMGVLRHYNFRVDPAAGRVQFRPRSPILATVQERIARWDWAGRCEDNPACVSAEIEVEPGATFVDAVFRTEHDYAEPTSFQIGCLDEDRALVPGLSAGYLVTRDFVRGQTRRHRFSSEAKSPRFRHFADALRTGQCTELVVLDVNPELEDLPRDKTDFYLWRAPN